MRRFALTFVSFLLGCQAAAIGAWPILVDHEDQPFAYVGVLYNNFSPICTVEMIDQRTFVTAAHCFDDGPATSFETVSFDGQKHYNVVGSVQHEDWTNRNPYDMTNDIAVGYLGSSPGIAPVTIRQVPVTIDNLGDTITVIGRSMATMRVSFDEWILGRLEDTSLILWPDPDHFLRPGDSGGALLLNGELAGIHVLMIGDDKSRWTIIGSTDVGQHAEWLNEHRQPDPG